MDEKNIIIKKWLENLCKKKYWSDYLAEYGYYNIAIYGAGDIGRCLEWELKDTKINVVFFIDKKAEFMREIDHVPVILMDELPLKQDLVDAIVVTIPYLDKKILTDVLCINSDLPVMSLRDMVFEL